MSIFGKLFNKDKEGSGMTQEQKNIEKKLKNLNHMKYGDKKKLSAVEIDNPYFGKGVLVKDSSSEKACYIILLSGFGNHSFGDKPNASYDLYEINIQEDNLDYVLTSLEQIYKKADLIMEGLYDEIYKEIIAYFEAHSDNDRDIRLKNEFSLDYLKENWRVNGVSIYGDHVEISIGINAAEDPEGDVFYDVYVSVDYSTQEPSLGQAVEPISCD